MKEMYFYPLITQRAKLLCAGLIFCPHIFVVSYVAAKFSQNQETAFLLGDKKNC